MTGRSIRAGGMAAAALAGRYAAHCSVAGHRAAGMAATVVIDAT